MKEFLAEQKDWLEVEQLPGYAPDLNPVEDLWQNIKTQELANQSSDYLSEVVDAAEEGLERVQGDQELLFGFLGHTGHFF